MGFDPTHGLLQAPNDQSDQILRRHRKGRVASSSAGDSEGISRCVGSASERAQARCLRLVVDVQIGRVAFAPRSTVRLVNRVASGHHRRADRTQRRRAASCDVGGTLSCLRLALDV